MLPDNISWYWFAAGSIPADDNELTEMISHAMAHNINVFEADSRIVAALSKYPRDSYYLFAECDIYELKGADGIEEYIDRQLDSSGADRFDLYYLSWLNEATSDNEAFNEKSILKSMTDLRDRGKIGFAGILYTGFAAGFSRFMNDLAENIDFCGLFINYIDWHGMESFSKAMTLRIRDIPVIAFRPTRNGLLENVSAGVESEIHRLRPECCPLDWCISWLRTGRKCDAAVIEPHECGSLSAFIDSYENCRELTAEEDCETLSLSDMIKNISGAPYSRCINCNHCAGECPAMLNIGYLMMIYKNLMLQRDEKLMRQYRSVPENQRGMSCISCGNCVWVCQERLSIPQFLADLESITANL